MESENSQQTTEQQSDENDIYEVEVMLPQTATVAVQAPSREAAWDAVTAPVDMPVQSLLSRVRFRGDCYQAEDILAVNDVSEADLRVTDDGVEVADD